MRPIPRSLLPHTIRLHKEINEDAWGDGEPDEGQIIEYVRMESSTRIIRDKSGAEIQLAATMFYDCRNSLPRDVSFIVDDIITFNGQKHKVKVVELLYDRRKPHHYELGLIKDG